MSTDWQHSRRGIPRSIAQLAPESPKKATRRPPPLRLLDKLLYYRIAPLQVRYLSRLDYDGADGLAAATIEQMERDFVVGPPITVHLPNPELMAGLWSMARECLAAGQKRRALGEVV